MLPVFPAAMPARPVLLGGLSDTFRFVRAGAAFSSTSSNSWGYKPGPSLSVPVLADAKRFLWFSSKSIVIGGMS